MSAMEIGLDILFDPLIVDRFNILRRQETVGSNGRSTTTTTTIPNCCGTVNMFSDREVIREKFPEMEYATNIIVVIAARKLQTEVTGFQPDIVQWRSDNYLVKKVSPYPQFGIGFYQSVCASVDFTDSSP